MKTCLQSFCTCVQTYIRRCTGVCSHNQADTLQQKVLVGMIQNAAQYQYATQIIGSMLKSQGFAAAWLRPDTSCLFLLAASDHKGEGILKLCCLCISAHSGCWNMNPGPPRAYVPDHDCGSGHRTAVQLLTEQQPALVVPCAAGHFCI